ncbi:MAG: ribbon-helix-helix domain-containing protein [Pseudomonadota bacterium]
MTTKKQTAKKTTSTESAPKAVPTPAETRKTSTEAMRRAAGTTLVGRNIRIDGRRTSVRLEPSMWNAFYEIGRREGRSIDELASDIARLKKHETSLTAALRVFIMAYYKEAATEAGHKAAGHGMEESQGQWSPCELLQNAYDAVLEAPLLAA